jgi:ferredoxin
MKVKIDEENCTGCGVCESMCPDIFELEEDKAKVKNANPDDIECAKEAAESCPGEAITVEE